MQLRDLYGDELGKGNFIGFNEFSREEFVNSFLNNNSDKGDLRDQDLGMEILYSASKIIYDKRNGLPQLEEVEIPKTKVLKR